MASIEDVECWWSIVGPADPGKPVRAPLSGVFWGVLEDEREPVGVYDPDRRRRLVAGPGEWWFLWVFVPPWKVEANKEATDLIARATDAGFTVFLDSPQPHHFDLWQSRRQEWLGPGPKGDSG
jgi:hypothetical protein